MDSLGKRRSGSELSLSRIDFKSTFWNSRQNFAPSCCPLTHWFHLICADRQQTALVNGQCHQVLHSCVPGQESSPCRPFSRLILFGSKLGRPDRPEQSFGTRTDSSRIKIWIVWTPPPSRRYEYFAIFACSPQARAQPILALTVHVQFYVQTWWN